MLQTVKKLDSKTIKVILSLLTDKSVVILYVFIFKIKYPICCLHTYCIFILNPPPYFFTSKTHQLFVACHWIKTKRFSYQTNLTNYFTRRFLGSSSLIDFVAGPGLTLSFFTRGDGFGRSSENIHNTLQSFYLSD
jgi:hypothetical protein